MSIWGRSRARLTILVGLVICSLMVFAAPLQADPDSSKMVTLCFKSYERDPMDGKYTFVITSSELPAETGDWHPGMVDKTFKVGDMVGSFKIVKFTPMTAKGAGDKWGDPDRSILVLLNSAKTPAKVGLVIGEPVSAPAR